MFLQNKYSTIYFSLIQKAKARKLAGYSERHHIIPKCMGGDDLPSNIVRLTGREHYLAHLLLCKMTDGASLRKMAFAFTMMNGQSQTHQRDLPKSRWYAYSRQLLADVQRNRIVSDETRNKIGFIAANRSPESIQKMRDAKSKPCTVDGVRIFASRKELGTTLGWGKSGVNSKTFKYL